MINRLTDPQIAADMVAALLSELGGRAVVAQSLLGTAADLMAAGKVTGFVAYHGDDNASEPIGVILLNPCAAIYAGGVFGEITELYVKPNHRSSGVAKALVAAAKAYGIGQGWARLEVGAPPQPAWARTLNFYERAGFEVTGPRLRYAL